MAAKNDNLPISADIDLHNGGTIKYANEVIAIIAGVAAGEVDGIAGMCTSGGISDIISRNRNVTRGVRVELGGEECSVDLYTIVEYGKPIQKVALEVQENVRKAVETMTGLHVVKVDVHVQGVSFEKENQERDAAIEAISTPALEEAKPARRRKDAAKKAARSKAPAEAPVKKPEPVEAPVEAAPEADAPANEAPIEAPIEAPEAPAAEAPAEEAAPAAEPAAAEEAPAVEEAAADESPAPEMPARAETAPEAADEETVTPPETAPAADDAAPAEEEAAADEEAADDDPYDDEPAPTRKTNRSRKPRRRA